MTNLSLATSHASRILHVVQNGLQPAGIEPHVTRSWYRCLREYRIEPSAPRQNSVLNTQSLKELQQRMGELLPVARAEMESLYEQIAGSGFAVILSDTQGVVLTTITDPALQREFRQAGLTLGALWDERHEGTNGIGTCLAEGCPVTVHREEHFRGYNLSLSCSGAPILDPHGSIIAVLDASTANSSDSRLIQRHTMALVNMSAQLIEKCIFLQHHHTTNIVRFHARPELVNLLHDGSLALGEDGSVIAADEMAVRLLGTQGRHDLVGRTFEEIFDTRIEDMLSPGPLARQALWPLRDVRLGRRFFALVTNTPAAPRPAQQTSHPEQAARPTRIWAPNQAPRPKQSARLDPAARSAPTARAGRILTLEELAGDDAHMAGVIRKASRVADSKLPVLIQGPTGSGKECFARALHVAGPHLARPFVAVNCAALPETLIESELFGYGPGAFTGARKEGRKGKIVQSSGGTLFLDEIGDMPLLLQTRLLRVLEEQEVIPLGAETGVPVDLRVICASNRDLRGLIAGGGFRKDLYYRLNGITLELPPLATRADKDMLIRRFLLEEAGDGCENSIDADALRCLTEYTWPGNIRELRNVIRSAFAICDGSVIRLRDLPAEVYTQTAHARAAHVQAAYAEPGTRPAPTHLRATPIATPVTKGNPLEHAERETVLAVIRANHGNLCNTAKQLGISRSALYRKLKRHGITVSRIAGLNGRSPEPEPPTPRAPHSTRAGSTDR